MLWQAGRILKTRKAEFCRDKAGDLHLNSGTNPGQRFIHSLFAAITSSSI